MRPLTTTLALLTLAGCLSAKQEDALEQDSHQNASQTNEPVALAKVEEPKDDQEESDVFVEGVGDMDSTPNEAATPAPAPTRTAQRKAKREVGVGGLGSRGTGAGGGGTGRSGAVYGRGRSTTGAPGAGRTPARSTRELRVPPRTAVIPERSTEEYTDHGINPFTMVERDAKSTFSIDVDTASYTIARRKLEGGVLPPWESVRVEEFVNYLDYGYQSPTSTPFQVHMSAMPDPFRDGHHIMRVGVQAKRFSTEDRPPVHLTFLADVSGSMSSQDKLPLAKEAMHTLVDNLREDDTVAIATYAGRVARILGPTEAGNARRIHQAIDSLSSGGSTAMSSGIDLAYQMAMESFEKGAENRVVIMSDGDANVGRTSWDAMLSQIKGYADKGVTLSTVGFGMGNYRDTLMEQLANKGDGNNFYIDSRKEADRVFSQKIGSSMITVARDVKIQVEFNPESVVSYRLLGYENRDIADRDFRNDKVDAGEVGSGHSVTALFEVILSEDGADADGQDGNGQLELATVRLRYEKPGADGRAKELRFRFDTGSMSESVDEAERSLRLAYATATFAEVLRQSPHASEVSLAELAKMAKGAARTEEDRELARLIFTANRLGATDGQSDWTAKRR